MYGEWAMSHVDYIQEAVRTAVHLAGNHSGRLRLPKKKKNLFKMFYDPELDTSPYVDPDATLYYLPIIGVL